MQRVVRRGAGASRLGREVELLTFPDEGHGVDELVSRAISWRKELEFMGHFLGFK